MTYQQAYGMADHLVATDARARYLVTDNGQQHGSDNYEVVERSELAGRRPIVRFTTECASQVIITEGWGR